MAGIFVLTFHLQVRHRSRSSSENDEMAMEEHKGQDSAVHQSDSRNPRYYGHRLRGVCPPQATRWRVNLCPVRLQNNAAVDFYESLHIVRHEKFLKTWMSMYQEKEDGIPLSRDMFAIHSAPPVS